MKKSDEAGGAMPESVVPVAEAVVVSVAVIGVADGSVRGWWFGLEFWLSRYCCMIGCAGRSSSVWFDGGLGGAGGGRVGEGCCCCCVCTCCGW